MKFEFNEHGVCSEPEIIFKSGSIITGEEIGNRYKEVKVVLIIAHLDHDEENHNVSLHRLKALCQMCHLRYDSKEKYRRIMAKSRQLLLTSKN